MLAGQLSPTTLALGKFSGRADSCTHKRAHTQTCTHTYKISSDGYRNKLSFTQLGKTDNLSSFSSPITGKSRKTAIASLFTYQRCI